MPRDKAIPQHEQIVDAVVLHIAQCHVDLGYDRITPEVRASMRSATPRQRGRIIREGRLSLDDGFLEFMNDRHTPSFSLDIISQTLFSKSVAKPLLLRGGCTIDDAEEPASFFHHLLFLAAALRRSLTQDEFMAWFAAIYGPLVEVAEEMLEWFETASELLQPDHENEDGASVPAARKLEKLYLSAFGHFLL